MPGSASSPAPDLNVDSELVDKHIDALVKMTQEDMAIYLTKLGPVMTDLIMSRGLLRSAVYGAELEARKKAAGAPSLPCALPLIAGATLGVSASERNTPGCEQHPDCGCKHGLCEPELDKKERRAARKVGTLGSSRIIEGPLWDFGPCCRIGDRSRDKETCP